MLRGLPEWRNGYTQGTQNPPAGNGRVGSNPTSGTGFSRLPRGTSRRSPTACASGALAAARAPRYRIPGGRAASHPVSEEKPE